MKAPLTPEQFDAINTLITFRLMHYNMCAAWSPDSNTGRRIRDRHPQELEDLKAQLTLDIPE